ncbi:MAG: alpha-galactosidase, partial [Clostridia bacterium]|nr:alpha-galactosidase [Clostridia bacterium]
VKLSAGAVEETGGVQIVIELFSQICSAIKEYEVIVRIDRRKLPFYECVKEARRWWDALGYKCAPVPNDAKLPMYSTWYSFHQSTIPDEIIK